MVSCKILNFPNLAGKILNFPNLAGKIIALHVARFWHCLSSGRFDMDYGNRTYAEAPRSVRG